MTAPMTEAHEVLRAELDSAIARNAHLERLAAHCARELASWQRAWIKEGYAPDLRTEALVAELAKAGVK